MTSHDGWYWIALALNPEPWAIGDVSVGRGRGGKLYPVVGRNQQLHFYKEAVREEIGKPEVFFEGKVELDIYYWRQMDEYKTHQARTARKNEADTTNLNKATEDALQGVFFENDRDVARITGTIVEQGPDVSSAVLIGIRAYAPQLITHLLPEDAQAALMTLEDTDDNEWNG